jgi:hypothetical protein
LDGGRVDILRGRWEEMKRENPMQAFRTGVPSWMVLEEWRGEDVETFHKAAGRVKEREFPGGFEAVLESVYAGLSDYGKSIWEDVTNREVPGLGTEDVLADVVVMCLTCGVRPRAVKKSKCWGCIKAKSRAKV